MTHAASYVQDKTKELKPYLDQIDVLDESVSELANTAMLLDDYSKRLGTNNIFWCFRVFIFCACMNDVGSKREDANEVGNA
jgi:hypothetical protein